MSDFKRPDGIERQHIHDTAGSGLRKWPSGLAGLFLLLAAAAFGLFGAETTLTGSGSSAKLVVEGPLRIRSGEYFEMLVSVETDREIRDAVLRVDENVWRDITVNTLMPQPSEAGFRDGSFEFHFGSLAAGARLLVKVDAQVNPGYPPSYNKGTIAIADGTEVLAAVDYSMRAFP